MFVLRGASRFQLQPAAPRYAQHTTLFSIGKGRRGISSSRVLRATFTLPKKTNESDVPHPSPEFHQQCQQIAKQHSFPHAVSYMKSLVADGKLRPDIDTFNNLFALAADHPPPTNSLRWVKKLLNEMWFEHQVNPNEDTFRTIIKQCVGKDNPQAIVFFTHMTKYWGLKPDADLCAFVLDACLHTREFRQAEKCWKKLKRYDITPTREMFHIMLQIAHEERDVDAAVRLVQKMYLTSVTPSVDTFNIVLELLRDNASPEKEVADLILAMQECGVRPSDATKRILKEWIARRDELDHGEVTKRTFLDKSAVVEVSNEVLDTVLSAGESMSIQKQQKLEQAERYFDQLRNAKLVTARENRRAIWMTVASEFERDYLPREAFVTEDAKLVHGDGD